MKKLKTSPLIAAIALLSLCQCHSGDNAKQDSEIEASDIVTPSRSESALPSSWIATIGESKSLHFMLLDPFSDTDSAENLLGCGEVIYRSVVTDSVLKATLDSTFIAPDSFKHDDMVKESTFLPDITFSYINETDTAYILYSVYCDICRFYKDGEYFDLNAETVRRPIITSSHLIAPKDKYLRNLKRQL